MAMVGVLPAGYTVDAVPEKRTEDEEQLPSAAAQESELLQRAEREKAHTTQGRQGEKETKKQETTEDESKKNKESERKNTESGPHVNTTYNFNGCSNLHVGHVLTFSKHYVIGASANHKGDQSAPRTDKEQPPHSELPKKLLASYKPITKEDCIYVSEYSSCKWDELGELLFFEETTRLEQYKTQMDKQSRKKAIQLILEEWRRFAGKNAMLGRLAKELLKLNEIEALKKLAKRHSLD